MRIFEIDLEGFLITFLITVLRLPLNGGQMTK